MTQYVVIDLQDEKEAVYTGNNYDEALQCLTSLNFALFTRYTCDKGPVAIVCRTERTWKDGKFLPEKDMTITLDETQLEAIIKEVIGE